MIRDAKYYRQFEDELMSRQQLTHEQAMRIFEAFWEEGRELGALTPKDPLEGIESDFRLAEILNSCSKSCSPA